MKHTHLYIFITLIFLGLSCKKDPETSGASVVKGCMDNDAYNFNSSATEDNGNCVYIKTTMYEVSYYAKFKEDGSTWDAVINTNADLILKIKEQGASTWLFESTVMNNQNDTIPAQWNAPTVERLKNKTYEWELLDNETIGSPETIATGSFNPINDANNNEIVSKYTDANGLETQIKVYYFLQK